MSDAPKQEPRLVYAFKKQLLVARISSEPGNIEPTIKPDDNHVATPCAYATVSCMSTEWEPDLRRWIGECTDFDQLLHRLTRAKYRVEEKKPRFRSKPFFRL